jgi:hypothetical protein
VLFSTGNDHEDHGPAMSTSSDTLFALAFCSAAALRTGTRYLAHAPFTSSPGEGDERIFSPQWLDEPVFFDKVCDFCSMVLDVTRPRPEGVLLHVPYHGLGEMQRRFDEFTSRLEVRARLVGDIVCDAVDSLRPEDYADSPLRELAREGIEGKHFQHAGFFDYCVAEALGHLDRGKLDELRRHLQSDPEDTLRRHPAVHNLAGYVRYGGPEFNQLRQRLGISSAEECPPVDPKWQNSCPIVGQAIVKRTVQLFVDEILDFESEVFC